jgi:hypothetical protein
MDWPLVDGGTPGDPAGHIRLVNGTAEGVRVCLGAMA